MLARRLPLHACERRWRTVALSTSGSFALVLTPADRRKFREVKLDESMLRLNVPAPEDFYSLLSLDFRSAPSPDDIKTAYRKLQRTVHPDLVGPSANAFAVILNACYTTLMDDALRTEYDFELKQYLKGIGSFDGRAVSAWLGHAQETKAVFVAENECIGCRQCTVSAPNTFFIEDEHGRARVSHQWGDDRDAVQEAVESCPVDCIYYVQRSQLPLLEFVMKSCKRESTAIMGRRRSGNMGPPSSNECPFDRAVMYVKARKEAKVDEKGVFGSRRGAAAHDMALSAAIAKAWLELPQDVRAKGWPQWVMPF